MTMGARLLGLLLLLWATPAAACTLCHSDLAGQVRAAVFAGDFWSHAGALAAPVPILLAAVLLVRRCSP